MAALVAGSKAWMAGTSPAMTPEKWLKVNGPALEKTT
jgi:hypothetical protein